MRMPRFELLGRRTRFRKAPIGLFHCRGMVSYTGLFMIFAKNRCAPNTVVAV